MRRGIILSLLFSVAFLSGAENYIGWYRVMTDSATPESFWMMCSYDKSVISKKLDLMVPASEVHEAAFEYEIMVNPFDPKRKAHVFQADYRWADLLLKVNGKVVFCGPAGPHILIGTHVFPFPAEYLKDGENLLELSWAPLKPEDKGQRWYGYIYVACDLTDGIRDLKDRHARIAKAPEALRMRLLIK